ncbi:MAG: MerR family DNA-binding transcriptional regulator [Pseudomonadota bacterium]
MTTYSITDLAKENGITPRTIRFYEDQGLITPDRQGAQRVYSKGDRARLAWILRGKRVGFSLSEIREMLDLYEIDDDRATQRQVTLEKCRDRISTLKQQQQDLAATIDELETFCQAIENLDLSNH